MTSGSWQELGYIYYDTFNLVIFFHIVYATLGFITLADQLLARIGFDKSGYIGVLLTVCQGLPVRAIESKRTCKRGLLLLILFQNVTVFFGFHQLSVKGREKTWALKTTPILGKGKRTGS